MKKYLLFLSCLIFSIGIFSQSYTIKGTVVDEIGDCLIGVTIVQKGTLNGAITDADGNFSVTIHDGNPVTLVFSYIGYLSQEVKVSKDDAIDGKKLKVVLKEDAKILDEVVVTGYAVTKKATITGSVSTVSSSSLGYAPGTSVVTRPGLLTAGEVNDFSKWALWDGIVTDSHSAYVPVWKMKPTERYMVQLTTKNNMPVADAVVQLVDKKGKTVWQTRSDNTGKAELWANIYTNQQSGGDYKIVCEYRGTKKEIKKAKPFDKKVNTLKMDVPCNDNNRTDIMFIVDATGSMGDEIRYLQTELADVIKRIKASQPQLDIRMGSVFYRDKGDQYVTRISPLDGDINKTLDFMKEQSAGGGGDYPEAVEAALEEANKNGGWHEDALARIAFLVLDAPCHNDSVSVSRMQQQIALAAQKGIRLVPVACSGLTQDGEYLLRSMALATNGTTLFLTDDSGIGNTHLKPTTDKMEVEMLNDMLVRLLIQYTKIPDCANDDWVEEDKKEADTDKFVPDPYDNSDLKTNKTDDEEDSEEDKKTELLTNNDVIIAYPNPCTNRLEVKIKKDITDLFFIDISGKSLQRFKNLKEGHTTTVNVGGYAAGVYFAKAFHNGKWYVQKIIVRGY